MLRRRLSPAGAPKGTPLPAMVRRHVSPTGAPSGKPPRATLLAAALLAAGALAGCGGSSSPFSGSAKPPTGFAVYHGSGFTVAVPPRFVAKPARVPGQPSGSTVTELTRGGAAAEQTNAEVMILKNPHLTFTLDQVVQTLEREDSTNPAISQPQFSARTTTVPGAKAARIVTERYVAPDSPSNPKPTTFDRKWLMVLVRPGVLLDVIVADAPALGGHIDADAVIDSFRLKQ